MAASGERFGGAFLAALLIYVLAWKKAFHLSGSF